MATRAHHPLQEKIQRLLDNAVDAGEETGCQAAVFIDGALAVDACAARPAFAYTCNLTHGTPGLRNALIALLESEA